MYSLKAKSLQKRYKERLVVRDVSIDIHNGEIVGLLGPNGAGKTTSFYMIVGLVKANSGQILINDHDITHYPMHKRSKVGISYLPQEASIFRRLSVYDNIMAILELQNTLTKPQRKTKADQLIEEFNLGKNKKKSWCKFVRRRKTTSRNC